MTETFVPSTIVDLVIPMTWLWVVWLDEFDALDGPSNKVYKGRYVPGNCPRPTVKASGDTFRNLATAALGTNSNLGEMCCKATKFRGTAGASRNPLADARCRSMMV